MAEEVKFGLLLTAESPFQNLGDLYVFPWGEQMESKDLGSCTWGSFYILM